MKLHPYRTPCFPEPDPFPSEHVYRAFMDRMRTADEKLDELRRQGIKHVAFYPDGSIQSVEFGPQLSAFDDTPARASSEDQQPSPRPAATARLIPRVQRDGND